MTIRFQTPEKEEHADLDLTVDLYYLWADNTRVTVLGNKSIRQIEGHDITIEVTGDWTDGRLLQYGGNTVAEVVKKAREAQKEKRKGEK